eukprot:TRINITY_DN2552_c0_g1_i1.p1 TRINITY_DN2552_c0_g1~~TRINITY_DN2552_c0_g1_i1.p1  ORF type:complete len:403 (-),score=144.98 TRINITY_DN2552_c0_g1_i1:58-1266(-)
MADTPPTVEGTIVRAKELFKNHFKSEPTHTAAAPGRVNLIGEHTDYNDGFVMPLALQGRNTVVTGARNTAGVCRVITESEGGNSTEFKPNTDSFEKAPKWANYVKGPIVQFFKENPGDFPAFDMAIATDVPLGGGLSSSASLEVAVFTFLEGLFGPEIDKKKKALLCQKAENDFVGMPCGCMDQFISVMGKEGNALLLDCRSQDTRYVPVSDPSVVLLVVNSNVKHELTGGEYAERRAQCYEAVAVFQKAYPNRTIKALRDVTKEQLAEVATQLTPVVAARARHVIGENDRTVRAADAFAAGQFELCGKLMIESHKSLRDDFEVSCKEIDILVDAAVQVPGVYGSRITGGGFGGCTITLLKKDALANAIKQITENYVALTGITPTCFATTPGEGARSITIKL